jgi:hypothetical protein
MLKKNNFLNIFLKKFILKGHYEKIEIIIYIILLNFKKIILKKKETNLKFNSLIYVEDIFILSCLLIEPDLNLKITSIGKGRYKKKYEQIIKITIKKKKKISIH